MMRGRPCAWMLVLLTGCGSSVSGAPDALVDAPAPADAFAAVHDPFPQVPNQGGRVLANLELVTVTPAGYPYAAEVEAFGDWVVGSAWLATVGAEYGVGTGTHLAKVRLAEAVPQTLGKPDVEALLRARIADGTLPPPDGHPDILYALFVPPTTTLLLGTEVGGRDFSGYHSKVWTPTQHFAYAANGACDGFVRALSLLENIERTASHELLEATTDPDTLTAPTWVLTDSTTPWSVPEGELGDLCRVGWFVRESGMVAQRIWSNRAAAAGGAPCIPAPEGPYFNVSVRPSGAVRAAAGQTVVLEVRGWSTVPVPDWAVHVPTVSAGDFDVAPRLGATTLGNGGTLSLTLTVPPGAPHGGTAWFRIASAADAQSVALGDFWPVTVTVP